MKKNNPIQLVDLSIVIKQFTLTTVAMKSNHKGLMCKILQKKLRKNFEETKLEIQPDSIRKIIVWNVEIWHTPVLLTFQNNIVKEKTIAFGNNL